MLFLRVKFDSSITCKCSIVNSFKNLAFVLYIVIVHFLTLNYSVYLFSWFKIIKTHTFHTRSYEVTIISSNYDQTMMYNQGNKFILKLLPKPIYNQHKDKNNNNNNNKEFMLHENELMLTWDLIKIIENIYC